jgi:enterochelin esterase-like enzyme
MTTPASGPLVTSSSVTFRLPDPHRRLHGVRLSQELHLPADRLEFGYRRGAWSLRLARPAVDRMEYLFELAHPNGARETVTDPANPLRAPGAFGAKSVIEFPGYAAPRWLGWPAAPGELAELAVHSVHLGTSVHLQLWTPAGLTGAAPLLVAHDGPEYAELGGLLHYAAAMVGAAELAPLRLALLAPGDRNRWYAAYPAYARALITEVLPALAGVAPHTVRVGAGASLGALAMLHAHRSGPGCFDGLFLQSGSFFTRQLDPQERRFARFGPVTRFVAEIAQAVADPAPVPVAMTCGALEENLANNLQLAATLRGLGYPVVLRELADMHNFTAWRDGLDPSLTGLLRQLVAR